MLVEAIESIMLGNERPSELIIIDQSDVSNPDLARLVKNGRDQIRYLWTQSIGLSRACNSGIGAARHDLLVFTHDDVLVSADWLGSLVRSLVCAGSQAVVTGRVLPTEGGEIGQFAPSTKADEMPEVYEGRIGADVLFPMSMAMYRSCIDKVGSFDERLGPGTPFPAAEDNDFGFRILESKYRIIYVPEAVLYHRAWRSERDYLRLRWSYARGQGAYYAKYLSLRDRYMLWRMVRHVKDHAKRFVLTLPSQRQLAYGHAVYVLGLVSGAAQWLMTQRRMP